jgi:hypothetical protein
VVWGKVWIHLGRFGTGKGRGDFMDSAVLDDIINRLLEVRGSRPSKQVQLSEAEIRQLCITSKDIFMGQPNLLEFEAPIKICGNSLLLLFLPFIVLVLYVVALNLLFCFGGLLASPNFLTK